MAFIKPSELRIPRRARLVPWGLSGTHLDTLLRMRREWKEAGEPPEGSYEVEYALADFVIDDSPVDYQNWPGTRGGWLDFAGPEPTPGAQDDMGLSGVGEAGWSPCMVITALGALAAGIWLLRRWAT
jgi:hypothetical protein